MDRSSRDLHANSVPVRCWLSVVRAKFCTLMLLLLCQATMAQDSELETAASVGEIPDGYFLFEEDILLPVGRATYGTSLWPGGVVPFQFDGNVTAENQQRMLDAMAAWEAVATVDFVPRSGESNYLYIFSGTANYSEGIGMAGGRHDISIVSWTVFGTLAHELAHALGYWHEQSRADRDAYVGISWANVSQSECDGSCDSQFEIRGSGGEYGPYDFDSVMHYGACAFSCCQDDDPCETIPCTSSTPNCRTITVLHPNDVAWQDQIGQRDHLSVFDALTMSFLYPHADWRFVEQGAGGSDTGTFQDPYRTWSRAMTQTPTGGTLWIREPDLYSAVGTYARAMTWRTGYGTVTLGN